MSITALNRVAVNGPEINRMVIERIRTMVAYEMAASEIVEAVTVTESPEICPVRWIAFMVRMIEQGRA